MEKFMLIFHGGSDVAPEMKNPEAMQKHMHKWFEWVEKLRKEGRYESGTQQGDRLGAIRPAAIKASFFSARKYKISMGLIFTQRSIIS